MPAAMFPDYRATSLGMRFCNPSILAAHQILCHLARISLTDCCQRTIEPLAQRIPFQRPDLLDRVVESDLLSDLGVEIGRADASRLAAFFVYQYAFHIVYNIDGQ